MRSMSSHRTVMRRVKVIIVYLVVVVAYLVFGGVCMSVFEASKEQQDNEENEHFLRVDLNLTQEQIDQLYDHSMCSFKRPHESAHWTVSGATFYSLTVITTIGYGSFAPKTLGGRTFTIFYAMFGISVIGLLLSNLAIVIGDLFKSVASRVWLPRRVLSQERHDAAVRVMEMDRDVNMSELQSLLMFLFDVCDAEWNEAHEGKILKDICARCTVIPCDVLVGVCLFLSRFLFFCFCNFVVQTHAPHYVMSNFMISKGKWCLHTGNHYSNKCITKRQHVETSHPTNHPLRKTLYATRLAVQGSTTGGLSSELWFVGSRSTTHDRALPTNAFSC